MTARPPHIRISGSPMERGTQLGHEAADQIRHSIALYQRTFAHFTGLAWSEVRELARAYEPAIASYDPELVEEMAGTAQGAGLDFEDILAINTRTEVMYGHSAAVLAECTSVAARGRPTKDGGVIVAQNWDWLPAASRSTILLEVAIPGRPAFVTFVEAGLAAKMGFNSAGVAMVTNLLLTDRDVGTFGVPFHVILRNILLGESFEEAKAAITRPVRASSGNYLIATAGGDMVNIEAQPGSGPVHEMAPVDDVLIHTNSFCGPLDGRDRALDSLPDSPGRVTRMRELIGPVRGRLDAEVLGAELLCDHAGRPGSVCRHADESLPQPERLATLGSIVIDISSSTAQLCFGAPCEGTYVPVVPAFVEDQQMLPR
ncbi:C45 family autoproteolytic acyltransferase/hydolase [Capillimicrobium parvum]|uniref:Peptidase C45 hydrolase domain-containing protein n=1 Tax=Capillimicrobium parvum TaxID=2884022 RepID=A0A9E6Y1P7_9ACTN|nr:C45 family peptidase [Capillimicrobium parvum]UGS38305.1 hypothetical protein DSM104329_04729 [Capillimicrobium parvum]